MKTNISAGVQNPEIEIIIVSKNAQLVEKIEKAAKKEICREIRNTGEKVSFRIISTQ